MAKTGKVAQVLRSFDDRIREASKGGLLLGMACNFAFVVQAFFAPAMTHVTPVMLSFTDMSYICGAICAAVLLMRARKHPVHLRIPTLWGLSLVVALMFFAYSFLVPSIEDVTSASTAVSVLFLVGGALFGLYLACVIPLWLRVCAAYDPDEIVWTILLAGSIGAVLVWFLADMAPTRLTVASVVLLLMGTYMLGRALGASEEADEAPRSKRASAADIAPTRLFVACFLVAFAFAVGISFAETNGGSSSYTTGTFFAPVLLACVFIVALRGFTVSFLLNIAVPIMTAVVMTASFFDMEPVLSFDLAVLGVFLFLVYAVVVILFATYGDEDAAYRSFLTLALAFAGGCVAGRVGSVVTALLDMFVIDVLELSAILAVVTALLLCVGMSAAIDRGGQAVPEADPALRQSSALVLERRIDRMAEKHNLGRREKEVLTLLLDGKTAGEIAGIMVVAPGTAKSHVYHVHKKLGVHSRSELFELFGIDEETRPA